MQDAGIWRIGLIDLHACMQSASQSADLGRCRSAEQSSKTSASSINKDLLDNNNTRGRVRGSLVKTSDATALSEFLFAPVRTYYVVAREYP